MGSIIVDGITKFYGLQKSLDEVSFEIKKGEILGFIGPNGAGKSTMMKIITAYLPQSSGRVTVNGHDNLLHQHEIKKIIGYLPENNPLYLEMYVKEYLSYVGGLYKLGRNKKKRIDEIVELTGLALEQNKKIGALSKGYRQRVGLAQALIHNPEILILDEPTTGLDPNQIVEIRNLIANLGKEKTIMLSTHLMQEVEAICDRVIIINMGKIVADDKPENIQNLSTNRIQTIIVEFQEEVKESQLRQLTLIDKVMKTERGLWLIQTNSDLDLRPELFRLAVSENWTILSIQRQEKSLESVFQELTGK